MPARGRRLETPRPSSLIGRLALGLWIGLALTGEASAALGPAPSVVEFWVIEPNEGQASGGHAAIRIDDWVYHVEHRGDGLIADRRTPRARFEEVYRLRENRGIDALPLRLDAPARIALKTTLEQRFYARKRILDRLDAAETEARWLEQSSERGLLSVEIPGYGLFEDAACSPAEKARGDALLRRLRARHGRDWLSRRRREARHRIEVLVVRLFEKPPSSPTGDTIAASRPDAAHGGLYRRLVEATQLSTALDLLTECRPLAARQRSPAARARPDAAPAGPEQLRSWSRIRSELANRWVELLASDRPDLGLALLLARARLEALDHSIETGHLFVLDPRRLENVPELSLAESLPPEWLEARLRQHKRNARRARRAFEDRSGPLEVRFAALERVHHAELHLRNDRFHVPGRATDPNALDPGLSASVALRYAAAPRLLTWPRAHRHSSLLRAAEAARKRADRERARSQAPLRYRLMTQNCVTELLVVLSRLESNFDFDTSRPLEAVFRGRFIPAVAADALERSFETGPRRRLPSARQERLAERAFQGRWRQVRERITLTSQLYRPHSADSSFLFFTDQAPWSRPILGSANLGYGLATAGVGLVTAPLDGGQRLRRGLQGAAMSVPEIFFWRIRQGTYLETHPEQRERLR